LIIPHSNKFREALFLWVRIVHVYVSAFNTL
jgi:hypothetical protein